ncbi:MAG: hypothetical protein QW318_09430 [Candidatus Caldarchaeum sp.]
MGRAWAYSDELDSVRCPRCKTIRLTISGKKISEFEAVYVYDEKERRSDIVDEKEDSQEHYIHYVGCAVCGEDLSDQLDL